MIEGITSLNTKEEVITIIEKNRERITELQLQQMAAGIDKTGEERTDEYSPFTVRYKKEYGEGLGAETDRVTFFMSGEMYSEMKTRVDGDEFFTEADNFKFDKMVERVGLEKYGLDPQSRLTMADEVVLPEFSTLYFLQTGIKVQ